VLKLLDTDLLTGWRAGDRAAGDELFRRHYRSVQRFFRNTVDPAAIDDLVQSTFIACAEARDRFEGRSSFRSYLFGVAHNVLRSHYRQRAAQPDRLDFQLASVADLGLGQSSLLEHKREQRVLLEALRQIPLESQLLLQLRYWEQLRTAELAEFLAVPRGTAVDRLRRAQARLQEAIARLNASPDVLSSTRENLDGWAASLRRDQEHDPQLSAVIPERLGRSHLVARRHATQCESASYRGGNTELELALRRLDPDESTEQDLGRAPGWTAIVVDRRPAWLQWDATSRRVEVRLRVGWVLITLQQWPAAPETALELLATLAFDSLTELE
jgi:RNA polymerase sigma factor (sigma-70 family)